MLAWWRDLGHYHLANPEFLVLVPVVLAAAVWAWRRRLPALLVAELEPFRAAGGGGWSPTRWPLALEALGLLLLLVALARPQYGVEESLRRAEGIDLMLVLDVSGSMDAIDVPQAATLGDGDLLAFLRRADTLPRLELAKREVARFVAARPNDRLGLIAFASSPYTVCPPTLDHDFLLGRLQQFSTDMLDSRQTGIAAALATATARLKDSPAKRRVAVLITDGQETVQDKITPTQAARLAKEFGVVVHTVGVGSGYAYMVRDGYVRRVPAEFDEKGLRAIAGETGGQYLPARDAAGFLEVMRALDALEKTTFTQPHYTDYRERFLGWLIAGLACLLLAFALEHTLLLKVP